MFWRLWEEKCLFCGKDAIETISYTYIPTNFSWDKDNTAVPNIFFCSQEHRKQRIQHHNELVKRSLPYLAELDESMNYCEWFVRDKWNDGRYVRDWFEYRVSGLWDYKTMDGFYYRWDWSEGKIFRIDFREAFEKYFWHFNWFKLHHRYDLNTRK